MDTVARLLAIFLAIPENWPGSARALYFLASPVLFPLWLVALVLCTMAYALFCLFGLLILAAIELRSVRHIIADTMRHGGAESFEVMENVGRALPAQGNANDREAA